MGVAVLWRMNACLERQRVGNRGSLYHARRAVVLLVGGTVLGFGVVLIVLPGPSILVIPLGLAILATEFVWARRLLGRFRWQVRGTRRAFARVRRKWAGESSS